MATDWVTTLQQTVPRLIETVRAGRPDFELPGVHAVTGEFLRQNGIDVVIWDVDGTLTSYHGTALCPEHLEHLECLFTDPSLVHVILSNCGEARFAELGRIFPDVMLARAYMTDAGPVFRRRTGEQDSHSPEAIRRLREGGGRVIRKPSPIPFRLILADLGETDPRAALMVGDQYLTDVAGANQAGIRSAKIPTCCPESFPAILRLGQRVERHLARMA